MNKLQIEITNACNFACDFCPHPRMNRAVEHMDLGTFRSVVDNVVQQQIAPRIELHVLGEPMLQWSRTYSPQPSGT